MDDFCIDDILSRTELGDLLPKGWDRLEWEATLSGKGIVYVLKLEEGKYYVGWTQNLPLRIEQHWDGRGAKWTQKYQPVKVMFIKVGTEFLETRIAHRCRQRWGTDNVRGGPWRGE